MADVKHVTDEDFAAEVENAEGLVLVDFWAPWCGPCQMLGPIIEELAKDNGDKVKVCKVNVDESRETAQKYGVMSIPTVALFKGGEVVETAVGTKPKEHYDTLISSNL